MFRLCPDLPADWYPRYLIRVEESRWDDALPVLQESVAARVLSAGDLAQARVRGRQVERACAQGTSQARCSGEAGRRRVTPQH